MLQGHHMWKGSIIVQDRLQLIDNTFEWFQLGAIGDKWYSEITSSSFLISTGAILYFSKSENPRAIYVMFS